jgi:hypothetical protein
MEQNLVEPWTRPAHHQLSRLGSPARLIQPDRPRQKPHDDPKRADKTWPSGPRPLPEVWSANPARDALPVAGRAERGHQKTPEMQASWVASDWRARKREVRGTCMSYMRIGIYSENTGNNWKLGTNCDISQLLPRNRAQVRRKVAR